LDFRSLQHTKAWKSTFRGVSRSRYVPPSGFGYPLDGLLLPSPCRVCFTPTALLGFHPSELSPLERFSGASPLRKDPHAVSLPGIAIAEATALSGKPRLLGFDPSESPLRNEHVVNTPNRRMLPWVFSLPGYTGTSLTRDPSRLPLPRGAAMPTGGLIAAPQSINRLPLGFIRPRRGTAGDARNDPLRVSAPARSCPFGRAAFRAMCSPQAAPYITVDRQPSLEDTNALPKLVRIG
jgi:hypothetical protein